MLRDSNSDLLNIDPLNANKSNQISQFEDANLLGTSPRASSLVTPITQRFAALSTPADIDIEAIGANWIAQGPSPATNGQTENVRNGNATGALDNQVIGAIHTVVAHPTDPNTLWVGTVNGGIWRTNTANQATPTWTPLTDQFRGLSIGAMALDPTDTDPQGDGLTIIAGVGHFSSYRGFGGPLTGLLLSTNGGDTFRPINDPLLQGLNISGVVKRGSTILVSANNFFGGRNGGVYRSTDDGITWNRISVTTGLASGAVFDLVGDPTNSQRFYVSVQDVGIFRSDYAGATWRNVLPIPQNPSDPPLSAQNAALNRAITTPTGTTDVNNNTEMTVAANGRIYVGVLRGIMDQPDNRPAYIGYSDDQGTNWIQMDLPITLDGTTNDGTNPEEEEEEAGGQGVKHFSIVADPNPNNFNLVYVGGDRQPDPGTGSFPTTANSIGATSYSGRLFRGDTTQTAVNPGNTTNANSPQWEVLTHQGFDPDGAGPLPLRGGTQNISAPHADSRDMAFDASGNLIEVDDGGIYRRTSPQNRSGDWFSLNGNLQVTAQHDIAYDTVSNILISGNQDTGTTQQTTTNSQGWTSVSELPQATPPQFFIGDGGDVAVSLDPTRANVSVRYLSYYDLGTFTRQFYDNSNNPIRRLDASNNPIPGSEQQTINLTGAFNAADVQFRTPIAVNAVDSNRLIIGGTNNVYEATNLLFTTTGNLINVGTTIVQAVDPNNINPTNGQPTPVPLVGVNGTYGNAIAYGGQRPDNTGALQPNPDALYVGSGNDVYVRTAAGGNLVQRRIRDASGNPLVGTRGRSIAIDNIRGITLDNRDWQTAFAIDNDNVFQTTNAGTSWTDITGDLFDPIRFSNLDLNRFANPLDSSLTDRFNPETTRDYLVSIEFISSPTLNALVVGTTQGVFASLSNDWSDWFAVGPATQPNAAAQNRLPHVPVWDMDFDAPDNLLAVGTLGRGAWTINNINTVLNSAPRPNGGSSYDVNEGSFVVLDTSSSSDPNGLALTYTWDLDGDGNFGETGLGAIRGAEVGINPTFSAAELNGPRDSTTVKLRVTNSEGSSAVDKNIQINIKNVAPAINGITLSSTVINENDTITLTGSFIDPGIPDTHTVTVNWGDGTTSSLPVAQSRLNRSFQLSHQYLDDSPSGTPSDLLPITVTVTDSDGGSDQTSTAIRVNNIAPVITSFTSNANFADRARINKPVNINATFTDIGTLDTHRAFVNWGDGTPTQEVSILQSRGYGTVQSNHIYAKGGAFTMKLTLSDDDTGEDTESIRAIVIGTGPGPG